MCAPVAVCGCVHVHVPQTGYGSGARAKDRKNVDQLGLGTSPLKAYLYRYAMG